MEGHTTMSGENDPSFLIAAFRNQAISCAGYSSHNFQQLQLVRFQRLAYIVPYPQYLLFAESFAMSKPSLETRQYHS